MAGPPKHVIRFYGNIDYALQAIGYREITFLHPDKLNDPFDPPFRLLTDFGEDYGGLVGWIERCHKEDVKIFSERFPRNNWQGYLDGVLGYFERIRNHTFLFSTCGVNEGSHPKDNLYMWGHYASGHRGVAIEFDASLLAQAVLQKSKRVPGEEAYVEEVWCEINYTDELPKITCEAIYRFVMSASEKSDEIAWDNTDLAKIIKLMVRSKNMVWKREDEWRLMWLNDETRLKTLRLDLLDDTITAVYLGCLVADRVRDDFAVETKRNFPNAAVFVGKRSKSEFGLVFESFRY